MSVIIRDLKTWSNRAARHLDLALAAGGLILFLFVMLALVRGMSGLSAHSLASESFAVHFHVATIVPAILLGIHVFVGKKGTRRHVLAGRIWCLLMFVSAISTLWIRILTPGELSWIHSFTFLTMAGIPAGIWFAMRRQVDRHRRVMRWLYGGAILIPGTMSFPFGRIMGQMAFG